MLDVRAARQRVPLRRRMRVVLRYAFDVPERAVAAFLGIPVGAVKSHTSRGHGSGFLRVLPLMTWG